jgi:hypothetical protein
MMTMYVKDGKLPLAVYWFDADGSVQGDSVVRSRVA